MIEIVEGVFLGNREAARDAARLHQHGITHVVNCAEELPNYHEDQFEYLALKLLDPDPNLHLLVPRACAFIDAARQKSGKVLVHCFAAVSRSPAVVLAYLCHRGDTLEAAAMRLGGVVWSDPDWLFLQQLARLRGPELSEEELRHLSGWLRGTPDDEE